MNIIRGMVHYTKELLQQKGVVYGTKLFDNLKRALAFVDPDNSSNFDNWDVDEIIIENSHNISCACGHDIKKEYRIVHITTGDTMVIGSVCIDKFGEWMTERRKEVVSLLKQKKREAEKRIKDTETAKKHVMTFGQFKGKTLEYIRKQRPSYLRWLAANSYVADVKQKSALVLAS